MKRPAILRLVLAVVASLTMSSAIGQGYPNRPVRMVIPFPPGGTLDALGRAVAQKVGDQMGQPFVVENRPGGNGIIGGDAVAKAQPDGYTLLFNASTFVTAPMTPLPPGRFSITNVWPICSDSFCASARPSVSSVPPGGNGMSTRTARLG